ncbi:MAG: stage II sporulation protein P, partial [Oscillospiraceae bacterium]|nr:stage II sporulation protein P [Oscillospiraceae bacterium]
DQQRDRLARLLVEQEVGPLLEDEPSLWAQMVTAEFPLTIRVDEAEEDSEAAAPPPAEVPAQEPEETEPAQEPEPQPEEAIAPEPVERTIGENDHTLSGSCVAVNNSTGGISVDPAALAASLLTQTIRPASEGPQILIMHTHATEAYTMEGEDRYVPTDTDRTDDPNYNVLRVGDEMKAVFEEMGFSVLHDTTLYDYPQYTGSYARSMAGIRAWLEEYPSISVVLDVHRDALVADDGTVFKTVTQLEGQSCARVMLVVGTNDGGLDHPGWRDNLNLAAHIQLEMTALSPSLARPINLRSQRFNQHLTPCSLLVEVGSSGNTLQEALRAARCFARSAGAVYQTLLAPGAE